jgi:tRNA dimethylallyltransferase
VVHHLIDILPPYESYSAARFCSDAMQAIDAALQRGLSRLPGADAGLREQIALRAHELGWAALHSELAAVDPAAAQRIHPNDPQRIQRALEVWQLTGVPLSEHHRADPQTQHGLRAVKIVVSPPQRDQLHTRIEQRFDAMLQAGLVDEVAALRRDPRVTADMPAMRAVGYRQVWNYLAGDCSYSEMRERAIISSRQLAKRQLTWLRRESDTRWFTFKGGQCRQIHDYIDAAVARAPSGTAPCQARESG